MMIDPRRLRFLLAVARYGGVLAAADELQVTASAVSQQLAKLEHETGHVLIRRTPTGSVLTSSGQALAEAAEDVERVLAVAGSRLDEQAEAVRGEFRLGGFQSFLTSVVAPAVPDWRRRFPSLQIETVEAEEAELLRDLRAGTLDAMAVELDAGESYSSPRGTVDVPLLDEPWRLVVPAAMRVPNDVLDLSRLALPWLGLHPGAASTKAVRRVARELGGSKSPVHTFYSYEYALALVAAGEGMTLVPALALEHLRNEGVDVLDVPGLGMRRLVLRHLVQNVPDSPSLSSGIALVREASAAFSYASTSP